MKQRIHHLIIKSSFILSLFALVAFTSVAAQDIEQLPLGSTLPLGDVSMEDIS